jgi:hypothetical protein
MVHESAMARMERTVRRLWILLIITVVFLVGSNALWIWYESQFGDVYTEITQENDSGFNSYIGNDGDINNHGEANDQDETPRP